MKKSIVPLLTVVALVSIILAGCIPTPETPTPLGPAEQPTEVPETPEPEPTPTPEPEPAPPSPPPPIQPALPKPGEWTGRTESGELVFTVTPDSTGLNKISLFFPGEFTCGSVQVTDWKCELEMVQPEYNLCSITNGQFTLENRVMQELWKIVVKGTFDETGMYAFGTWEVMDEPRGTEGITCQEGTWEASAP